MAIKTELRIIAVLLSPVFASAQNTVAITEFMSESGDSETLGEWVELYNYGASAVNVGGWTLVDDDTDVATLPAADIAPGGYLIVARNKVHFEVDWLAGINNPKVVGFTGTFAMSATSDELVLKNGATIVWRLAYRDDETVGRATFFAGNSFTQTIWGTKASPGVDRGGNDVGGTLGYEDNWITADAYMYSGGNRDWGSPLQGHYGGGTGPETFIAIDALSAGTPFNPGVRGVALADITIERPSYFVGIPDTAAVSDDSSLRGVAGGLYADLYDWRTRVSSYHASYGDTTQPRPTTLEFLRMARDHSAELFITANSRGLVEYDPINVGKVRYYTSDTLTLASLAADWVRYANHIVPSYRQGDSISDERDAAIMSALVWNSATPGDNFETLLTAAEESTQRVTYWEIGNEPNVGVSGGIGVSNGYTLNAASYHERYKAIASAMKAEDPEIKVGLCLVNGSGNNAAYVTTIAADAGVPIDFISYHPYQRLGDETTIAGMEEYLATIFSNQHGRRQDIRDALAAGGRDPDVVELVASEVNVSNWPYNETLKEGEMAHALGSVETIFTFARLGLTAAHYWIWPADQDYGTRYPLYKAIEALRDQMGDTLIDFCTVNNSVRIYATRKSGTPNLAVWILNFRNSTDQELTFNLSSLGPNPSITRYVLKNTGGVTALQSANYSANRAGGPRNEVDWVANDLTGSDTASLAITAEAATLTLLVLEATAGTDVWAIQ